MPTNPTPSNRTIIDGRKWLRTDAAQSYLRARKAGMPAGGIASAGRTKAEQEYLYRLFLSGKGNLAAPPGKSQHESGICLDITRNTLAHRWAVKGGSIMKVHPGERLNINQYGWYRTVPSEAWHFQYFPDKDKVRTMPTVRKFRFGQANVQGSRFGGLPDESPLRARRAEALLNASIYALSEINEDTRDAWRAITGQKVWPINYVAVMFGASWESLGCETVEFNRDIHGAVNAHLRDKASGKTLDVISIHVRPGDSYPNKSKDYILAAKADEIRRAGHALVRPGYPTIWAGDFNTSSAPNIVKSFGFADVATDEKPTTDSGDRLDFTFITPNLVTRSTTLLDPEGVSDHKWRLWQGTLGQDTT